MGLKNFLQSETVYLTTMFSGAIGVGLIGGGLIASGVDATCNGPLSCNIDVNETRIKIGEATMATGIATTAAASPLLFVCSLASPIRGGKKEEYVPDYSI